MLTSLRSKRNRRIIRAICRKHGIDNSDSLDGSSCSLYRYSIYNSNDQWRFFNTMESDHRGKGEEKRTILRYFLKTFRLANSLRGNQHAQPFKLRRECMKILLPCVNIIVSILFLLLFCVQNLCKYHAFN